MRKLKARQHARFRQEAFFGFLILLTLLGTAGCGGSVIDDVPQELIGTWETSEERYEGCSIEITPKWIIFENPSGDPNVFKIKEIRKYPDGPRTIYRLRFENSQEKLAYNYSLYYYPEKGGVIVQKFQDEIQWKKSQLR